jgi:hypothetical protein
MNNGVHSFPIIEEHVTSGDVINQIQPGRIYKIRDSLETNNAEKELTILCWSGEPKTPLTIWKSATVIMSEKNSVLHNCT